MTRLTPTGWLIRSGAKLVRIVLFYSAMTTKNSNDKDIDYTAEGSDPGSSKPPSPTDRGYDEAAHSGSTYGTPEGEGGVFGTTGGGTYGGGMQIEERPLVYEPGKPKDRDKGEKS